MALEQKGGANGMEMSGWIPLRLLQLTCGATNDTVNTCSQGGFLDYGYRPWREKQTVRIERAANCESECVSKVKVFQK